MSSHIVHLVFSIQLKLRSLQIQTQINVTILFQFNSLLSPIIRVLNCSCFQQNWIVKYLFSVFSLLIKANKLIVFLIQACSKGFKPIQHHLKIIAPDTSLHIPVKTCLPRRLVSYPCLSQKVVCIFDP